MPIPPFQYREAATAERWSGRQEKVWTRCIAEQRTVLSPWRRRLVGGGDGRLVGTWWPTPHCAGLARLARGLGPTLLQGPAWCRGSPTPYVRVLQAPPSLSLSRTHPRARSLEPREPCEFTEVRFGGKVAEGPKVRPRATRGGVSRFVAVPWVGRGVGAWGWGVGVGEARRGSAARRPQPCKRVGAENSVPSSSPYGCTQVNQAPRISLAQSYGWGRDRQCALRGRAFAG